MPKPLTGLGIVVGVLVVLEDDSLHLCTRIGDPGIGEGDFVRVLADTVRVAGDLARQGTHTLTTEHMHARGMRLLASRKAVLAEIRANRDKTLLPEGWQVRGVQ